MSKLKITTRENFNGASGKDFVVENVGSFFLTNHMIRKIGGVKQVKEVAEQVYADHNEICASSVISASYH